MMIVSKRDYIRARAKNVQEHVSIFDVLEHYDIPVQTRQRQSQYPCTMHGDGSDTSFSARVYPDDNSTYCWACSKRRDCISFVCDKENLTYFQAIKELESRYGVPPLPGYYQILDQELKTSEEHPESKLVESLETLMEPPKPQESVWDRESLEEGLRRALRRREASLKRQIQVFSLFDVLSFEVATGVLTYDLARQKLKALTDRI